MTDHDRINDEAAARLVAQFGLRVNGVGRDADNERTLIVYFDRRPTDDELRAVHEHLRTLPTPPRPYDGLFAGIVDEVEARKAAVGRAADRPGDLVPLANGGSVDLAGSWKLPT